MFEALAPNEMGAGNSTHAIHRAGRSGDLVVVRRYLKKPAILNRRDDEQMTCLHWYVHRSTRTSRIVLDFEALLGLASWASDKAVHCCLEILVVCTCVSAIGSCGCTISTQVAAAVHAVLE